MAGLSSTERENLLRQNQAVMAVFERAGFEHIAPDIIQPADIFLERSGEDIRARTFVFTDPAGREMCLRPDLTVPTCRYHLKNSPRPETESRYCYLGPSFRFPETHISPVEFFQAGIEWFGATDGVQAEARVLKLALSALEAAGLTKFRVVLGDLGLFAGLLADTQMPERWRNRLRHHFWRRQAFNDTLQRFSRTSDGRRSSISADVDLLAGQTAEHAVEALLQERDLTLIGGRRIADIATRLEGKFRDRSEKPIDSADSERLVAYLEIDTIADHLPDLARRLKAGPHFSAAITAFEARLRALEEMGLNPKRFEFRSSFGHDLEYYTGFVFQIDVDMAEGPLTLAGGGRYDTLLSDIGSPLPVPAIGCAVHTQRLQRALA